MACIAKTWYDWYHICDSTVYFHFKFRIDNLSIMSKHFWILQRTLLDNFSQIIEYKLCNLYCFFRSRNNLDFFCVEIINMANKLPMKKFLTSVSGYDQEFFSLFFTNIFLLLRASYCSLIPSVKFSYIISGMLVKEIYWEYTNEVVLFLCSLTQLCQTILSYIVEVSRMLTISLFSSYILSLTL